MLDTCWW